MKVLTKITRQKNNKERYNIYLDEQYAFSVDENTLIKFNLTKGKVLEPFDIDDIVYEDHIAKAYNQAINFLSYQMRSEQEVRKKLLAGGHGESVVEEAIHKLEKQGFLNDETYSKALLETKKRTSKKGPRAIVSELAKKGIDKSLSQEVMKQYSYEEQVENAKELADKVIRSAKQQTPAQTKQKIQDLLMRKGYSFSVVSEVLDQTEITRNDDEWNEIIAKQGEKIWKKYSSKLAGRDLNMKVKQALYQKGFPIDVINRFIEEKEFEDGN